MAIAAIFNKRAFCALLTAGLLFLPARLFAAVSDTSLAKIDPDVRVYIEQLRSDDPEERIDGITALEKIGEHAEPAIPYLVKILSDDTFVMSDGRNISPGRKAADLLVRLGKPAVGRLITAMRKFDDHARKKCVNILARIGQPAVKPLIMLTADKDPDMRNCAVEALKKIGDPESINPLIYLLLHDQDMVVRGNAAEALGRFTDPLIVRSMIKALTDKDAIVRQYAVEALGNSESPEAAGYLITAMKDPNFGVREQAVTALGRLNDPSAIEPLISALKDEDRTVRGEALKALCIMEDGRAAIALTDAINGDAGIRANVAALIDYIKGLPSPPAIIEIMRNENARAERADKTAADQPERRVPDELISDLTSKDPDTRYRAAEILGDIRDMRTVVPLILAMEDEADEKVRQELISTLQTLTKQKITDDAAAWRRWWKENKYKYL